MKQIFSLLVFSFITSVIFSQNKLIQNQETYDRLKADGKLDPTTSYTIQSDFSNNNNTRLISKGSVKRSANRSVSCGVIETSDFQDPWGGDVYFDDFPPAGEFEVQLPFSFCFYDQQYTSFFINNNGNITFDAQYTTFTSTGFPSATVPPMIAPFWGDVDTGDSLNPLGQVKFEVYSDYAVVSWDSVGVYPGSDPNQRNTFQLIITDGISPVLPPQTNICFIYGDMQWTTGTASQGAGGFGGTPATVGVNRGDGNDYIQLGRFDAPGTAYDGPFDNNDGVDYLDNSIFFFNTCLSSGQNNIAPLSIGAPICDTLAVCTGGTIPINFFFIPVEPGQQVDAELLTSEIPGLIIDTIIAGAQCEVIGNFTGTADNQGFNTISFLATDNGTPAADYQLEIVIQVLPSNFTPIITGTPSICSGESTILSVEGGPFEQYLWAPNFNQTPTTEITESNQVTVTVAGNGQCGVSEPFEVVVAENPTPIIAGQNNVCADQATVLYTTQPYAQYAWSTASSNDSITALPGQYIVTVIDENGCEGISPIFTVTSGNTFVPEIIGSQVLCPNEILSLSSIEPYQFYFWSNGSSDSVVYITEPGVYTLFAVNQEGCSGTSNPFVIDQDTILPTLPAIINAGGLLFTAYTEPIYWFLDGQVIAENVNFIQISEPGLYSYAAISEYGCFIFSDTFNVQITSLNRLENDLQPIVNTYTESGWIFRSNRPDCSYALFSAEGRCVKVGKCEGVIDASLLSSGIYLLNINTDVDAHAIKLVRR